MVLLLCSVSFMLLSWRLDLGVEAHGGPHPMSWGGRKNHLSIVLYALAIVLSLWYPPLGAVIHVLLATVWLMPEAQVRNARPGAGR